ncbi:MAG: hypothetical protein IT337_07980 [Thermomicrobiales bacterium]|nr:hypothetical protein [Thermomicrobiales bacterium]
MSDFLGWIVVLVVASLLGGGVVLALRGTLPLPGLGASPGDLGGAIRQRLHAGGQSSRPLPVADAEVIDRPRRRLQPERSPTPAEPDASAAPAPLPASDMAALDSRLDRLEARLEAFERDIAHGLDVLQQEAAVTRTATRDAFTVAEARQSTALERLRADVAEASLRAAPAAESPVRWVNERRAESIGQLYARLAGLESALAQATNPILLPGEAFAPPVDLPSEAMGWENWKEVGDRAFALADAYSAQRLYLSDGARADVAAFVTTLRGTLTRAVYPNLSADPTPDGLRDLRGALVTLSSEVPRLRQALEREFRAIAQGESLPER